MLGLLAALGVAGCQGKYARPVSDAPIAAEPARLQRGSYLVNNVLFCGACHTSREHGNNLTEPERTDAYLGGGSIYTDKGIGTVWVPNITPDVETGIGSWKDDEILRALRDGVTKDGRFMVPLMPFGSYQHLSDEDARAVVAYLRTVPPHKQPRPRIDNKLGFMNKLLFGVVGVQMHKRRPVRRSGARQGLRGEHQRRSRGRARALQRRADKAGAAHRHAPRRQEDGAADVDLDPAYLGDERR
jgi:mono/diheme cytochrome c family protein